MEIWKLPPRVKVLEALSAIADGRVDVKNKRVISSARDREYVIEYDKEKNAIFSNDNGSIYRGYLGYPAIAYLMLIGELPFNEKISQALKGIPWRKINQLFKNYEKVEKYIKEKVEAKGYNWEDIIKFANKVLEEIKKKKFKKLR